MSRVLSTTPSHHNLTKIHNLRQCYLDYYICSKDFLGIATINIYLYIIIIIIIITITIVTIITITITITIIIINKYKSIKDEVLDKNVTVELYTVEFTCLGLTSKALASFTKLLRNFNVDVKRMTSKCSEVCCRTSYYIFNRRGKTWNVKDILKFE